ncbi:MAG: glycine cleavage system protein GcvH [Treponemataceae bacterium]|nr:MAG: glycine cleavage system protein GcvH [Treponemataceae bacterium]
MNIPAELLYSESHEWVRVTGTDSCEIGLSDFAQQELGDIVFVNLPQVGGALKKGEPFADVESVKAVSDIYSPVDGTVTAINTSVLDSPEQINKAPYETWLIKAQGTINAGELLDAAGYEALGAQ